MTGGGGPDPALVALRLSAVHERIAAAGGDPERVRVLAVTKGFGPEVVDAAVAAGLDDIGENYAQELLAKCQQGAGGGRVRWHFIGAVQRNKVKALAPVVGVWESVDRPAVAVAIARHAPGATVLIEVNASGEASKSGVAPGDAPDLVAQARDLGLDVQGLMTIGPLGSPDAARPIFAAVSALADRLGLPERSMGMSADLEVAVQEGATWVRIGTALFGPRPPRPARGPRLNGDDLRR